jgi:hypothetical protein
VIAVLKPTRLRCSALDIQRRCNIAENEQIGKEC